MEVWIGLSLRGRVKRGIYGRVGLNGGCATEDFLRKRFREVTPLLRFIHFSFQVSTGKVPGTGNQKHLFFQGEFRKTGKRGALGGFTYRQGKGWGLGQGSSCFRLWSAW